MTRKGNIRNEHLRGTTIAAHASKKITERMSNMYGQVMSRHEKRILMKVFRTDIPGKSHTPNLPAIHFRDIDGYSNQPIGSNFLVLKELELCLTWPMSHLTRSDPPTFETRCVQSPLAACIFISIL